MQKVLAGWPLIVVLASGCSATLPPGDDSLAAPPAQPLSASDTVVPVEALVPQPTDTDSSPRAPTLTPTLAREGFFPGLRDDAERKNAGELPFERSVAERRKRIALGLESPRQADEPVNNVIDWDF